MNDNPTTQTDVTFYRNLKCVLAKYGPKVACLLGYYIGLDEMYKRLKGPKHVFYRSREDIEEDTTLDARAQRKIEARLTDDRLLYVHKTSSASKKEPNKYIILYKNIELLDQVYQADRAEAKRLRDEAEYQELQALALNADNLQKTDLPTRGDNSAPLDRAILPALIEQECPVKYKRQYKIKDKRLNNAIVIQSRSQSDQEYALTSTPAFHSSCISSSTCISSSVSSSPQVQSSCTTLLRKYTDALKIEYRPEDIPRVVERYEDLLAVEKFLNQVALDYVWRTYASSGTKVICPQPWISGFIAHGLLDALLTNRDAVTSYCNQTIDTQFSAILRGAHSEVVNQVIQAQGYHCNPATGDIEPPQGLTFTRADERRFKRSVIGEHVWPQLGKAQQKAMIPLLEFVDA